MAVLISPSPEAQQQILEGFNAVFAKHSNNSQQSLLQSLRNLNGRDDLDVVLTGFYRMFDQPEFGLAWFPKNSGNAHPLYNLQNAFMVGGLVYHPSSDSWSVNT